MKLVTYQHFVPSTFNDFHCHRWTHRGGGKAAALGGEGCNVNGLLKVKKVPGSLHIKLTSPRYDVDASLINASHQVGTHI